MQNRYSEIWSVLDFVSHSLSEQAPDPANTLFRVLRPQIMPGGFGTFQQWGDTIGQPLRAGLDHDASMKQLVDKQVSRETKRVWWTSVSGGSSRLDRLFLSWLEIVSCQPSFFVGQRPMWPKR